MLRLKKKKQIIIIIIIIMVGACHVTFHDVARRRFWLRLVSSVSIVRAAPYPHKQNTSLSLSHLFQVSISFSLFLHPFLKSREQKKNTNPTPKTLSERERIQKRTIFDEQSCARERGKQIMSQIFWFFFSLLCSALARSALRAACFSRFCVRA